MKKHKILALFMVLILSLIPMTPAAAQTTEYTQEELNEIREFISIRHVDEINVEELKGNTPQEIFNNLDQHSTFYNPKEFDSLLERMSGEYAGIGAYVEEKDGRIFISDTIEGSPSRRDGLKSGDEILQVDGKEVKGKTLQEVVDQIRGPEDTQVELIISREGQEDVITYTITRAFITIKSVTSEIIGDVGYLRIREFNENCYEEAINALGLFRGQGIDKIILDVRNNPGGLLDEVVEISRLLVKRGPILHVQYRNGTVSYMSQLSRPFFNNVVVLVNENSASASEILAAAIQDSKSGTIIGKNTHGKGSVQRVYFLMDGSGFKLTEARYLSPNKKVIDGLGVKPDYEVEQSSDADTQLEAALEFLGGASTENIAR